MAQWNHGERTLVAKVVYYGPALGGKTTNLESLHGLIDPLGIQQLLSLNTAADRTLFFDLLPMQLGEIDGYELALKIYTVPGQVRYESTRRVVLAGADAVVFVADSQPSREQQNQWSLQNLRMNLRANGIDPKRVPILFQANKQDLEGAAAPELVAGWLGLTNTPVLPAVATEGTGVLETFVAAAKAMLDRLIELGDENTRKRLDVGKMQRRIADALARRAAVHPPDPDAAAPPTELLRLDGDEVSEQAIQASVELAERLTAQTVRANRLAREVDALRRVNELTREIGASFDRERIVATALDAARRALDVPAASHVVRHEGALHAASSGRDEDPLLRTKRGRRLLGKLLAAPGPCVLDDLEQELRRPLAAPDDDLQSAISVPLTPESCALVAYASAPASFDEEDARFLAALASHLAIGLEKARLVDALVRQRDDLERSVEARTSDLREAYDDLKTMERVKDGFLSGLSHELKSPLTAITSSAAVLQEYPTDEAQRGEMLDSIVDSAGRLEQLIDDLFRIAELQDEESPLDLGPIDAEELIRDVARLSHSNRIKARLRDIAGDWSGDREKLLRALADLVDNALKFSPADAKVEIEVGPSRVKSGGKTVAAVAISVLDRGPGVPVADRERIFAAFEQGSKGLTDKPGGVGMGLHEARTIVERHGGRLEFRPRPGGGSEFRARVPRQPVLLLADTAGAPDRDERASP